jgi:hypothetical protein
MTVGAKKQEILESVVEAVTVDMVQFERERVPQPFGETALLTSALF